MTLVFEARKSQERKVKEHELQSEKINILCTMQVNGGVPCPSMVVYDHIKLNSKTGIGVSYFQVLDTYVSSEAQNIQQSAAFSMMEQLLSLHDLSVFISIKWFLVHGLEDILQLGTVKDHHT